VDSLDSAGADTQEDREEESEASNVNESSRQETDGTRTFKRKKRAQNSEFEDSLITLLKDSKDKEDDDDRAFLTSLLPSLKSLNPDQKLMFRSQVLHLIMSIKQNRAPAPLPSLFPNAQFNYGPQYQAPGTSTYSPANFYPNQNNNPFPPYQQGDLHSASTALTPLVSPNPSNVSTSSWETL